MPLFGKKTKVDEMSRKRLEYQLHLARHGPDNIVDLSDCELKHVPDGTYALSRVLLKEVLLLHSNRLRDLKEDGNYNDLLKTQHLRVLDAHNNQLIELPTDLYKLSSLQILNVQQNKLKSVPDAVCRLKSLQTLNLRENDLQALPDNVGDLCSLRTLDISGNRIRELPRSLARARCLESLILDPEEMIYPPADICKNGTTDVMKFLCEESGLDYAPPSQSVLPLMNKPESSALDVPSNSLLITRTRSLGARPDSFDQLAQRALSYTNVKEQRRKELARLEAELLESSTRQMELLQTVTSCRGELLRLMAKEQIESETKFHSLQERRDAEKRRFSTYLTNMEEHTKSLIAQLLDMNAKAKKTETLMEREERARQVEQGLFNVKMDEYERLRKKEVEKAMEMNACQFFSLEQLRSMQETRRDDIASRAKFEDLMNEENLQLVLHTRDKQMSQLLRRLIVEEEFQKEALLALMEQRDARSTRLGRQIEMIQRELAHLSILELRHKEEKEVDVKNRLREQREVLCAMMMQLLDEKAQRSKELQKRLLEMEKERERDQVDFWLIHYQRLLDTKPDALVDAERQLDMDVIKILNVSNAQDYIPAFARHHVTPESIVEMGEEDLQKMGMYEVGLRKNVLQTIQGYIAEKKLHKPSRQPSISGATASASASAPISPDAITVTARFEMECVICMAQDCGLVFLPCGHVCSCRPCGEKVAECPLCRAPIQQKVDLCAAAGS